MWAHSHRFLLELESIIKKTHITLRGHTIIANETNAVLYVMLYYIHTYWSSGRESFKMALKFNFDVKVIRCNTHQHESEPTNKRPLSKKTTKLWQSFTWNIENWVFHNYRAGSNKSSFHTSKYICSALFVQIILSSTRWFAGKRCAREHAGKARWA